MQEIESNIVINAPHERVWSVLTDFASYPEWSTFVERISGRLEEGAKLTVQLRAPSQKKASTLTPTLLTVRDFGYRWRGKFIFGFLVTAEHYFVCEPMKNGKTLLKHGEQFSGLLVPFLKSMLADVEVGFEQFNKALKKRVEST